MECDFEQETAYTMPYGEYPGIDANHVILADSASSNRTSILIQQLLITNGQAKKVVREKIYIGRLIKSHWGLWVAVGG